MRKYKTILNILLGAVILSIVGLYNGYPLVYSDTGTYIYSGFDKFIPNDRPVVYGLFLRYSSLGVSAWFVIFLQNVITAFVVLKVLQLFNFKNKNFAGIYFSILLFLVLFTGIGWYSNQLMPDFFTPLVPLIIFVLYKKKKLFNFSGILLLSLLILSLVSHFSHLLLGSVLVLGIIAARFFLSSLNQLSFRRILTIAGFVLSSWLVLPSVNYIIERQFILSKGSHVFLMAHLNDTGILKKFLDENYNTPEFADCKLCMYKDSLPGDLASFIWGGNILENTGGWADSKSEYDKIIRGTLVRPKYLCLNIYRSLNYGFIQLTKNEIGQGLSAYNEGSAPYGQIQWRFNDELNNYLNSRQNQWNGVNLKLENLNLIHKALIIFSLFFLILLFTSSLSLGIDAKSKFFLLIVIASIILNSFITAGLNSPCERFQARVIWLLPLALIIIVLKNYSLIKNTICKRKNDSNHLEAG